MLVRQTQSEGVVGNVERNTILAPSRAPSSQGVVKMCPPVRFLFLTDFKFENIFGSLNRKKY